MEERRENDKKIVELKKVVDEHGKVLELIQETLKSMNEKLEPIAETYRTTATLGKWIMTFLVFLSVLGGVIWTWCKIFGK